MARSVSRNAPAIVAAPATAAPRSRSRRERWFLRTSGEDEDGFALVSCGFRSSRAFFILRVPLQAASMHGIRRIAVNVIGEYPADGLTYIASFRQEFRAQACACGDSHGSYRRSARVYRFQLVPGRVRGYRGPSAEKCGGQYPIIPFLGR
jgi:hypothetical protein